MGEGGGGNSSDESAVLVTLNHLSHIKKSTNVMGGGVLARRR